MARGPSVLFGARAVVPDAGRAARRILELAAPEVWEAERDRAERYELDNVFPAWARIVVADRDPDAWVRMP